jgi:hypothetical protein
MWHISARQQKWHRPWNGVVALPRRFKGSDAKAFE